MDPIYNLINQIEQRGFVDDLQCGAVYALPKGGKAVITAISENRITIELIVDTPGEERTVVGRMEPHGLNLSSDFHGPVNP